MRDYSSGGAGAQASAPLFVFVIVGKCDTPLYECDLAVGGRRDDTPHLDQFIIHAALDIVEEVVWQTNALYLKQVDRFNEFSVSAYVTPGHVKFMMLHRTPSSSTSRGVEDNLRDFFNEVHELYVKTVMNPFYGMNRPIVCPRFDEKVKVAAKKHLL